MSSADCPSLQYFFHVISETERFSEEKSVFVAIGIQHPMRLRLVICGLPVSTIFLPRFLTNGTIFWRKKRVCSHRYPASNALASCHLRTARLYNISSTFSHKRHDFLNKKMLLKAKCALIFSTTFVWNISHSNKNWARYNKKCILVLN